MATLETSPLETAVRDLIARYVAASISAEDLADGLPDGWNLDEADEPAVADIVLLTIGYLAEYEAGDRGEDELRAALEPYASWRVERRTGSASPLTVEPQFETRVTADADTELLVVPG